MLSNEMNVVMWHTPKHEWKMGIEGGAFETDADKRRVQSYRALDCSRGSPCWLNHGRVFVSHLPFIIFLSLFIHLERLLLFAKGGREILLKAILISRSPRKTQPTPLPRDCLDAHYFTGMVYVHLKIKCLKADSP